MEDCFSVWDPRFPLKRGPVFPCCGVNVGIPAIEPQNSLKPPSSSTIKPQGVPCTFRITNNLWSIRSRQQTHPAGQIKDFPPNILGGASLHHKQLGAFLSISWLPFFNTTIRRFHSSSAKLGQHHTLATRLQTNSTVVLTRCRSHICFRWGTSPVHLSSWRNWSASRRNWSARKSLPVVCWLSPAPPWSCLQKIWEKQPTHNLQWPDWILGGFLALGVWPWAPAPRTARPSGYWGKSPIQQLPKVEPLRILRKESNSCWIKELCADCADLSIRGFVLSYLIFVRFFFFLL